MSPRPELEARFDQMVHRLLEPARRLAWRILGGDLAAAEDVTQDAFARAHRGLHRFRRESTLDTWFYRILVRQALNHRRWQAVRGAWSGDPEAEAGREDDPPDPFVQARIGKALQQLSPPQRDVFVLVHLEGFTVREASDLLGKRLGTTKTHLKRSLASLRRELGDLEP